MTARSTRFFSKLANKGTGFNPRYLHIPDRYGVFSPGPPLLQAYQANELTLIIIMVIAMVIFSVVRKLVLSKNVQWFPESTVALCAGSVISFYFGEVFFNPMRAPDYDWNSPNKNPGLVQPGRGPEP